MQRVSDVLERIGANVAARRAGLGLTQQCLADRADLDLRFIQRVERAQTNLSVTALVALAEALDVAPEALLRPAALPPARPGRPPAARRSRRAAPRSTRRSPR
jgi:transcriptional regulator with XRE-family HTH domain